ncbi:MAG: DUF5320 domain-containing protein [Deltaproteobacteria bacterium]|nr:DUF5320 domain-containing protein [Deltaproteobacteria bacterium]MBW2048051.1 DUF5320 domain-containing protein [Deltaproteobacteria bacterium]
MPGFDRTGPEGRGPMTGGGRGLCAPARAGYAGGFGRRPAGGRGFGRGYGLGRGYGRGYRAQGFLDPYPRGFYGQGYGAGPYPTAPQEEISALRAETDAIKESLDEIKRRLAELQKTPQET